MGCEGDCLRWFHRDCIKMPKSEYAKFCSDKSLKWSCNRADCAPDGCNPLDRLSTQLAGLIQSVSNLATKDEVTSIGAGIDKLRESMERRFTDVESRVDVLEEKINSIRDQPASCLEEVMGEIGERNRRGLNAIVYNLSESQSKDIGTRVSHDRNQLLELGQVIGFNFNFEVTKLLRIGRPKKNNPRPLKIVFRNEMDVRDFLGRFSGANLKDGNGGFSSLSASRDRTIRERKHLNSLRAELEARVKKGEKDITIKYRNGVPAIVTIQKND